MRSVSALLICFMTAACATQPAAHDGVMYFTSAWSLVYVADAKTGRLLWTFDPHVPKDHSKFVCR
jgi:glucose dehydrogenase